MIKAIETRYKGYLFRSRLEARWAVFFDTLGIKWEYEQEGFELSGGTRYLPDFYLPTFAGGIYAEVKPEGDDFEKARKFAKESKQGVWLCAGVPDFFAYEIAPIGYRGIPNFDQAKGENRMFSCPGFEEEDGSISKENRENYLDDDYREAIEAARGARF